MSSPEDKAYEIMRELDVSYVLVIFGGLTGYASDGEVFLHYCTSTCVIAFFSVHFLSNVYVLRVSRHQQVSLDGSYRR